MKKTIVFIAAIVFVLICSTTPTWAQLGSKAKTLDGLAGLGEAGLSAKARGLLLKNGFVMEATDAADLVDIYADAKERGQGQFITTDSMLHAGHIFFDYLLRILEIDQLAGLAQALTDRMLDLSAAQYREAQDPDLKEAARLNIGYFAVAKAQFTPGYAPGRGLDEIVKKELAAIRDHKGFEFRALLPYVPNPSLDRTPYAFEDYSQYVPRGHYTRNELFQKYFKVLMWYGRIDFKLLFDKGAPTEIGRKMTLQALLLTEALARDSEAMRLWRRIYEPTVYFVGKTDDLTADDYTALTKQVFPGAGLARLADKARQIEFMNRARKLRIPKILSGAADSAAATQGFRFMGQRFIPDSHIFQELVFGAAGLGQKTPLFRFTGSGQPFTLTVLDGVGPVRGFPRGLDVMAVLGSKRALEILDQAGDTAYSDYKEQSAGLAKLYAATTPAEWTQNLYWRWLQAWLPLLEDRKAGGPQLFLNSPAWRDKELQTALGSWTELRHDTILYAKQSYTGIDKSMAMAPPPAYGFVEPAPQVYARLAAMFRDLGTTLASLGLAIEGIPQKLSEFEALLARLEKISIAELAAQPLSEADYAFIGRFDEALRSLAEFPPELMRRITSGTDARMDIIADVHTETNSGQVLEEAVGSPANIFVAVRDGRGYRLCRGGIFTYYEFTQPMSDRLTDEQWQQMGGDKKRPQNPDWIRGLGIFAEGAASRLEESPCAAEVVVFPKGIIGRRLFPALGHGLVDPPAVWRLYLYILRIM